MFFFSFFFYHCFSFKAPLEKRTRLLCFPFSILFGAGRIFPLSKNKNTHVDSSASIFSLGFHFFFFLLWSFVLLQKKEREKKNDAFFLSLFLCFRLSKLCLFEKKILLMFFVGLRTESFLFRIGETTRKKKKGAATAHTHLLTPPLPLSLPLSLPRSLALSPSSLPLRPRPR